ncbi:MAG: tRNA epoxyqueuosine(34) reductase QueG [Chloroflexi bacterium]|nr:MAG: tRNA epoxyqueuosine(34) reductase QueG [Chloroflexota bacterium]
MQLKAEQVKQAAIELGFNIVGVVRAEPSPTLEAYKQWIAAGMHGAMGYMARPDRIIRRENLQNILPDAQSMIVVGLDYTAAKHLFPPEVLEDPSRGRIAAYAWGQDYHDVMTPKLISLAQQLGDRDYKLYVDTGAVLERSHGQQAGFGFTGKNTMLIRPRRGSYFFLGEIITAATFDTYDTPHKAYMCGTCTRCLEACPTKAFPTPYVLDARRCISYHTIENKGWIDRALRPYFGNWVFGCDICQDVCPFQRFAPKQAPLPQETPSLERFAPAITDLLALDNETFAAWYKGTPIYRIKRERMVRNACIAAGNWGDERAIPYLIQLLYDASPLIRGHAAWGLWQIMRYGAVKLLTRLYDRETDETVREEIEALVG